MSFTRVVQMTSSNLPLKLSQKMLTCEFWIKFCSPVSSGILPNTEELGERASPSRTSRYSGRHRWQQMRPIRCKVNLHLIQL